MSIPLTIPDRQTIRVLKYLWESLRSDPDLIKVVETAPKVVDSVLAREPLDKAGGGGVRLHTQGLPCLAFYRQSGTFTDAVSVNNVADNARFKLQYLIRVPQDATDYDGIEMVRAWCYNVWYSACRALLSSAADSMLALAAIRDIRPTKYTLIPAYISKGVYVLDGDVEVQHLQPPIEQDELDDLKTIAFELELYSASGVTTGYKKTVEVSV